MADGESIDENVRSHLCSGTAPTVAFTDHRGAEHFCICEACAFGTHHDGDDRWHTWASDVEARAVILSGGADPSLSRCGCACADGSVGDYLPPSQCDDDPRFDDETEDTTPMNVCPSCGSYGACSYDSQGRPLIHVVRYTDDEQQTIDGTDPWTE